MSGFPVDQARRIKQEQATVTLGSTSRNMENPWFPHGFPMVSLEKSHVFVSLPQISSCFSSRFPVLQEGHPLANIPLPRAILPPFARKPEDATPKRRDSSAHRGEMSQRGFATWGWLKNRGTYRDLIGFNHQQWRKKLAIPRK